MKQLFTLLIVCFAAAASGCAFEGEPDLTVFPLAQDAMADVDRALAAARAEEKLALIVLGANWCHDSRALTGRFDDPEMAALLSSDYAVQLVNVGYLDRGFDVADRFGLPVYTHTPTVLIVDPQTGDLVNADDHFQWRDAYKKSGEETLAYFTAKTDPANWAAEVPPDVAASDDYVRVADEIAAFEAAAAGRIRAAYALIGPRLEADSDDLNDYWRPVAKLRYRLPDDVKALREDAAARVAAGETQIELAFPEYPAWPWEGAD
ncbi:MAG: thioredoxin family protein [Pseudomonadota bacterium]